MGEGLGAEGGLGAAPSALTPCFTARKPHSPLAALCTQSRVIVSLGEHLECFRDTVGSVRAPPLREVRCIHRAPLASRGSVEGGLPAVWPRTLPGGAGTRSAQSGQTSCREARGHAPRALGRLLREVGRRLAGHTPAEESAFWRRASASSVPPSAFLLPKVSSLLPLCSSSPLNNKLEAFLVGRDSSQFYKFKPREE